jgi:hypothetical protein
MNISRSKPLFSKVLLAISITLLFLSFFVLSIPPARLPLFLMIILIGIPVLIIGTWRQRSVAGIVVVSCCLLAVKEISDGKAFRAKHHLKMERKGSVQNGA